MTVDRAQTSPRWGGNPQNARPRAETFHETVIEGARRMPRGVMASVGLGVAFGLGIVAGGGTRAEAAAGPAAVAAQTTLARVDARTADLERVRRTLAVPTDLSGADRLHPDPLKRAHPAKGAVAVHADGALPADDPAGDAERPVEPAPEAPVAVAAVRDAAGDDEVSEGARRAQQPDAIKNALARVLEDTRAERPSAAPPAAKAGTYGLQVASAPTQQGAEKLAQKLKAEGHVVRITEADVPGKGTLYRVRVGTFTSRDAALAYKAKLATPAFVIQD